MKTNSSMLGARYDFIGDNHMFFLQGVKGEARAAILQLLEQNNPEPTTCLCGEGNESQAEVLAKIDRWGLPVNNVICKKCGLVRIHPRYEHSVYENIYINIYWKLVHGANELTEKRFSFSVKRAKPFADHLTNNYELAGKKVLEIGASYGAGLYRLKDSSCERLVGYDYDKEFLEKGRQYTGLDLRYGGVDEAVRDEEQYDLVILRHVFEHFLDPARELISLSKLLGKNGLLFIEVPGVYNMTYWYDDPLQYFDFFHTYSYTLGTLKNEMMKNGYVLHEGNEHVYSFWKYNGKKSQVEPNAREAERIKKYIYKVERKRARREKLQSTLIGKVIFKIMYTIEATKKRLFSKTKNK